MKYVFVAEFAGVKTRVRTLAFWGGDRFMDDVEYDLADTPKSLREGRIEISALALQTAIRR